MLSQGMHEGDLKRAGGFNTEQRVLEKRQSQAAAAMAAEMNLRILVNLGGPRGIW